MTDRYKKVIKDIPTTENNAKTVVRMFLEHGEAKFGMPSRLLTDNSPPLVPELIVAIRSTHGVKYATTSEYHHGRTVKQSNLTPQLCRDCTITYPSNQRTDTHTCCSCSTRTMYKCTDVLKCPHSAWRLREQPQTRKRRTQTSLFGIRR